MKRFFYFIAVCVLFSCSTKKTEQKVDLIQLLNQTLDESIKKEEKNLLCMFISDNMCSSCVEKEFLNIKSANNKITLIGIFENKRNYVSSINSLSWENEIFIIRREEHSHIIPRIFYFIYKPEEKICSDFFYPDPCKEAETFIYFQKISKVML